MDIPLVGDAVDPSAALMAYELRLDDWVDTIRPEDYGLPPSTPKVDPNACFITSGDAVQKARYLQRSLVNLVSQLSVSQYRHDVAKTVNQAAKLTKALEEIKGSNVFLETEFNSDRQLLVIPKNPRSKGTAGDLDLGV